MDIIQGRMDLAVKYGADVAIFVHNIVYWVEKNAANRVNFHDGRYWTYNSARALGELYPLWSRDQIKRLVKRCADLGLILLGNYNEDQRDRSKWYTPSDEILELYGLGKLAPSIGQERPMDPEESPDTLGESAPPLPSIDQVGTTVSPYSPPAEGRRVRKAPRSAPDWCPERFEGLWKYYPKQGRKDKQRAMDEWDKLRPDGALIDTIARALRVLKVSDELWTKGKGIPYLHRFLRDSRWEDADAIFDTEDEPTDGGWADDPEVV